MNSVTEKYEPYLVGVVHKGEFAREVIAHILSLKVKSVGVESAAKAYDIKGELGMIIMEQSIFWHYVIEGLRTHGIKVIFLIPDRLELKLLMEEQRTGSEIISKKMLRQKNVKGLYPALVKDTMTRFMEKKATKDKPEAIVVGGTHAHVIQKDLGIPQEKYKQIGDYQESAKRMAKGILTFRRKRKIKKAVKRFMAKFGRRK